MALVRLQKLLSAAGVASRRASEALILAGRVTVNGEPVRTLGTKADLSRDDVRVDGRRVKAPERLRYLLINKPAGVVTTRSDPQGRPTVLDLVAGVAAYLYPVGRLDYDSEGLLILTNDGDLAAALTHPRHGVAKVYEVVVRGWPAPDAIGRLRHGVTLDGRRTAPAEVRLRRTPTAGRRHGGSRERAVLEITLREGRNRQVRRMCEAVGHPVERLTRVRIGPVADSRLRPGQWRDLSEAEIQRLREAVEDPGAAPGRVGPSLRT